MEQTQSVTLTEIDEVVLVDKLVEWARCRTSVGGMSGYRDRVVSDYLRHHLALLGSKNSPDGLVHPVHIHRLRASVRRQLSIVSSWFLPTSAWSIEVPNDERELPIMRDVDERCLAALTSLGEIVHCGNGFYLPTPLRAVLLESGRVLLVGGLSTCMVSDATNCEITWAGFSRCLRESHRIPNGIPQQSVNRWLGTDGISLDDWTNAVLQDAERNLCEPGSGIMSTSFEVYDQQSHAQQHNRWTPLLLWRKNKLLTSDLRLCRSNERPRRFWLARFSDSSKGLKISNLSDVRPEVSRRLMYGLDRRTGHPVEFGVRVDPSSGNRQLIVSSWLTADVFRLLIAIGYPSESNKGRRSLLPMVCEIPAGFWKDACSAMETLGIRLVVGR